MKEAIKNFIGNLDAEEILMLAFGFLVMSLGVLALSGAFRLIFK